MSLDLRQIWRRYWFHLGALMVIVPAVFLKSYLDLQALFIEGEEEGLRSPEVLAGPWTMHLQEVSDEDPRWDPREGWEKSFCMLPCPECANEIRAIFISLKRPGSTEYGAEFEGNPYRSFGDMRIGRNPSPDDLVWITVEGWDGSFHQVKLPLKTASPITAAWVQGRQ